MAKKKVKKKVSKKIARKKSVKRKSGSIKSDKQKINLVLKNLMLFAILALASFLLYSVSSNELLVNLFSLLTIVLGFVAGAFLIILLVFFFMRLMKK